MRPSVRKPPGPPIMKPPVQRALTPLAPEAALSATQKPHSKPMGPVSPVENVVNASMPQKGGTLGKALRGKMRSR
jgi:hypothetical protein